MPQFAYGYTLQKVTELEKKITADPKEQEVRKTFADARGRRRCRVEGSRQGVCRRQGQGREESRGPEGCECARRADSGRGKGGCRLPEGRGRGQGRHGPARRAWPRARAGPRPHAEPFVGKDEKARDTARLNFIGIVFCMMFGTAALPHILMRYYTTPSVQQARVSVFWSLFFIFLLYFTAPCLAVLAKYDMYTNLVGSSFASLPAWAAAWAKVDPGLLNITDINKDGIVQWAEVVIGGDLIVLATPEIAGPALRGIGPGGGRRSGGGALDGRRPAAHHRQRAVARSLLQDDRPDALRPPGA